jgi:PAS domain S-box-containing protein
MTGRTAVRDEASGSVANSVYRQFFETSADMLCIADIEGRIRMVNPAWERVLGWTAREICSRPYLDFVHPDDVEATLAVAKGLARGETVLRFANRYRTKHGDWRELEWSSVFRAAHGLVYATVRDITGERRAAASAAALEAVAGVGTWEYDPGTETGYWSPTVFALHGLAPGTPPPLEEGLAFFPAAARAMLEAALERLTKTGEPYDMTLDFDTAEGRRRVVRVTGAAERRGSRTLRLFGTFQDVTDLKRTEHRLADIIRGTNAGTWEWHVQTGEVAFNERWAEIVGYRLADLAPRIETWTALCHPDDLARSEARLKAHFVGETETYVCESRMRHRDGRWVWVLDLGRVASWTADGRPEVMSGTHIDITERKAQEEALMQARAVAEAANQAKSRFLANMSHEIRTPLNGVLGMAEVLDHALTDPAHRRMLAVIRDSGALLLDLINDILDLSKIEAERVELECRPFRPADLARKIQAANALKADSKGIGLTVTASSHAEVPRLGDEARIMQILHNLLGNAVKFTQTGTVTVRLDATPGKPLVITVADTGIGMTPGEVAHVFEEFTQADASTTRRFGGTGLGLAIVRRLIDLMRGRIDIDSTPGQGTCITVSLPLEAVPDEQPAHGGPALDTLPPLPALRVLAAEDNEINRIVLAAMLDRLGLSAPFVEDGAAAVAACAETPFDLLLLDISMPVIDGVEALHRIRALSPEAPARMAPAIAVTANALKHQVEAYLGTGFAAHVAKPIEAARLEAAMRKAAATLRPSA